VSEDTFAPHGERDPEPDHASGEVPRTGDEAVDAALDALRDLDPDAAPGEQLPVLTAVHAALQQRLSAAAE